MTDLETIVREAFRAHEGLAPTSDRLAEAAVARATADARRQAGWWAVGGVALAVMLLLIGIGAISHPLGGAPAGPPANRPSPSPDESAPPGWRLVSSLGVQLAVPRQWPINDYGCGMTAAATVLRERGAVRLCLVTEPPTATVVSIDRTLPARQLVPRSPPPLGRSAAATVIDGVPATMIQSTLADGRPELTVVLARPPVTVQARGPDLPLLRRVVATLHVVVVDAVGCPSARPARPSWDHPTAGHGGIDTGVPDSATVCYYDRDLLGASERLTGADAAAVVDAIRSARAGMVPDDRQDCAKNLPEINQLWLQLHYAHADQDVVVHFENCTGRYAAASSGVSQVTQRLLHAAIAPLRTGYGFAGDLPVG